MALLVDHVCPAGEEEACFGRSMLEMIGRLLDPPDLATGFGIGA